MYNHQFFRGSNPLATLTNRQPLQFFLVGEFLFQPFEGFVQSPSQKYPLKKPYPHRSYSEDVYFPKCWDLARNPPMLMGIKGLVVTIP